MPRTIRTIVAVVVFRPEIMKIVRSRRRLYSIREFNLERCEQKCDDD